MGGVHACQVCEAGAHQCGCVRAGFQCAQFGGERFAGHALPAQFLGRFGEGVVRQFFAVQQFDAVEDLEPDGCGVERKAGGFPRFAQRLCPLGRHQCRGMLSLGLQRQR